ncbi:hypothetical protein MKZ38_005097 [Zalerion maritima]|uniref:Infection structure specific protein n=1 Tax=Zalerion maritima TaxID=339359 RepID=A0AAD5RRD8_9PEZI|nr:hypothetical protein MKZ38_005097 [Zalerion maritima]
MKSASTLLLATLLGSSGSSTAFQIVDRDICLSESGSLARRAGEGLESDECVDALSSLLPLATSVPTPPAALSDALADVTITDPCSPPTDLPDDVASGLSSYTSELLDWYSTHSGEIEGALSQCPDFSSYLSDAPVCTDDVAAATGGDGGSGSTATASGGSVVETGSSSGSGSGSSDGDGDSDGDTASDDADSDSSSSGDGTSAGAANGVVLGAGVAAAAAGFIAAVLAL